MNPMPFPFVNNNSYQLEEGARSQESLLISNLANFKASNPKHKYDEYVKKTAFYKYLPRIMFICM